MKTTIKSILLLLVITSCQFKHSFTVKGNRTVTWEKRKTQDFFENIEISNGITLLLTEGKKELLRVEADENIHEHIFTEVSNGTLKIYTDVNTRKTKAKNVYVTTSGLKGVYASNGSTVITKNELIANQIELKTSSGSSMDIYLNARLIDASSSSGSSMYLQGNSHELNAKTSSGSQINAKELIAELTNVKASSGSEITIHTTDYLNAVVSSGAHISSYGNPKEINQKKSSGGMIALNKK